MSDRGHSTTQPHFQGLTLDLSNGDGTELVVL